MPSYGPAMGTLASAVMQLLAIALLRRSWVRRAGSSRFAAVAGWILAIASIIVYGRIWGAEFGVASALLAFSTLAYIIIVIGAQRREGKPWSEREPVLEPENRPTNWSVAIAKSLLAIVLAGVAAVGIGVAFAVAMPMNPIDRIVIGGLLVPMFWGGGMAWTLSDARIGRAAFLLCLVSFVAYGVAFFPKMLTS